MAGTTKKKTLHEKLFAVQGEIEAIKKDSTNPYFNSSYFNINSLVKHVIPVLQKHRLLLLQPTDENGVYSIIHDIDEPDNNIKSFMPFISTSKPQERGSEVSYYRRYTLQSLLSLEAEDDDAASVSGSANQQKGSSFDDW